MRILLIDHGCCDPPATRVHACREQLERLGAVPLACGPALVPSIEAQVPGLHGIHLHAIAAASRVFLIAIHDGSPAAFLAATASISPRLLGSVRETARQTIAEAVDAFDPDAIFVLHAGILADLAIETGVPVAIHVAAGDLAVAKADGRIGDLVAAALGSAEAIAAEDEATAATIARDWLDHDDAADRQQIAVCPAETEQAAQMLAACEQALARRRG
ncbi:MAG: hypothetical protein ACK52C_11690 [Planctomycetia bacterium]